MNKNLLTRRLIIVVVCVAVGGGLYYLLTSQMQAYFAKKFSPGAPAPVTVTAMKAELTPWQPDISAVGTLRAVQGVDIAPEVAGLVRSVRFHSGDTVKAGDVLVELNLDSDAAQLTALEAAADLADTVLRRDQIQFDAQAISQAQLDADKADARNKHALAAAQRALVAKKVLRAPFAGRVGIRNVNPGQYLNTGDKVVTLQAIDPILVDFNVPQQEIGRVSPGELVRLDSDAFVGKPFNGKVTAFNPKVDASTRNVQVEASVANPGRLLLPGMYVRVHAAAGPPAEYVTLPQTAITYSPYGASVYTLATPQAGKAPIATQVFVETGATRGDQVAVVKGVKPGDLVVTSGQLKLHNGAAVAIDNTVLPKNDPNPLPQEQ